MSKGYRSKTLNQRSINYLAELIEYVDNAREREDLDRILEIPIFEEVRRKGSVLGKGIKEYQIETQEFNYNHMTKWEQQTNHKYYIRRQTEEEKITQEIIERLNKLHDSTT